ALVADHLQVGLLDRGDREGLLVDGVLQFELIGHTTEPRRRRPPRSPDTVAPCPRPGRPERPAGCGSCAGARGGCARTSGTRAPGAGTRRPGRACAPRTCDPVRPPRTSPPPSGTRRRAGRTAAT